MRTLSSTIALLAALGMMGSGPLPATAQVVRRGPRVSAQTVLVNHAQPPSVTLSNGGAVDVTFTGRNLHLVESARVVEGQAAVSGARAAIRSKSATLIALRLSASAAVRPGKYGLVLVTAGAGGPGSAPTDLEILVARGAASGAKVLKRSGSPPVGARQALPGPPRNATTRGTSGAGTGQVNPLAGAAGKLNQGRENPLGAATPSAPKVTQGNTNPQPDQHKPSGTGKKIGRISTTPGGARPSRGNVNPQPGREIPAGAGASIGPLGTGPGGSRLGPGSTNPRPDTGDDSPAVKCPPGTPVSQCQPDPDGLKPFGAPGQGDPRVSDSESGGESAAEKLVRKAQETAKENKTDEQESKPGKREPTLEQLHRYDHYCPTQFRANRVTC